MTTDLIWSPHADTNQERFLACAAREAFFAGESGSGKSAAMISAPLRWMHLPDYSAIILRRTWPAIRDSLLPSVFDIYPKIGGQEHEGGRLWTWPNGGRIRFTSMERSEDRFQFKSQEHEFIGFEELDTFEEIQWTYVFSRNRTSKRDSHGRFYPLRMRANANPGGPGTPWIVRRYGPWIYREGHPDTPGDFVGPYAQSGETLWATTKANGERAYSRKPTRGQDGTAPISCTMFHARLAENRSVDAAGYRAALAQLDPLSRAQLERGDWFARGKAGEFFDRSWVELIDAAAVPRDVAMRARVWDRAATEPHAGNTDPDWTVGALVSVGHDATIYVEDIERFRKGPGEVMRRIRQTAELDAERGGTPVAIGLLHDPGQAGKVEIEAYVRDPVIARNQVIPIVVHADKVTIGKPFAAAAHNRRVKIVRAPWTADLLAELEAFPSPGVHDDQWDAIANAYRLLHASASSGTSSAGGAAAKARSGNASVHRRPGGF